MKRFLHALATLWPKKRATGSPPLGDPSTAIPQHLAAVLRMERILSGFAEETVDAGALSTVRDQSAESTDTRFTESWAQQLPESPDTRLTASPDTRLIESPDTRLDDSPNRQIVESPNQPQSLPRIPQPMPLLTILMLVFFMCLMAAKQVSAQAEPAEAAVIKPLQIGDTIPEELWHLPLQVVNHPEGKETITLNDYRGKLIILDFWATWCGSCIAAMPRIREVEITNAANMVMIPVTNEPMTNVAPFLNANHTLRSLNLFSVANDTLLNATFPHKLIPHYVWVSPDGNVSASTTSERVNNENIRAILAGRNNIPVKKEINPDRPLFLSDAVGIDDLSHYSILTKAKYDGLPSGSRYRRENGIVRGRALTNSSLRKIYTAVAYRLFDEMGVKFSQKRFILDVGDTTKLNLKRTASGKVENLYNFELIVPVIKADSLYHYMLKDLNRYTAYLGFIEKRTIKCYVLTSTGDLDRIKTKGGKPRIELFPETGQSLFINYPLTFLVDRLNSNDVLPLPIVDESGYSENVDLEFSGNPDVFSLKSELRRYNLDLMVGYRQLDMFILKEKCLSTF